MKIKISLIAAAMISAVFMTGCSDSDDAVIPVVNTYNGKFVDAAVQGMAYTCTLAGIAVSGVTDVNGVFGACDVGQPAEFKIGNTVIGSFLATDAMGVADSVITPNTIAAGSTDADLASKIAILMQSLDTDGNPDNGITIDPDAVVALDKTTGDEGLDFVNSTVADVETTSDNTVSEMKTADPVKYADTESKTQKQADEHLDETQGKVDAGEIETPDQPVQPTGATN